jgi:hypothetical protein
MRVPLSQFLLWLGAIATEMEGFPLSNHLFRLLSRLWHPQSQNVPCHYKSVFFQGIEESSCLISFRWQLISANYTDLLISGKNWRTWFMSFQKDLMLVRIISSKVRNDGICTSTRRHISEDVNLQNDVSNVHRSSAILLYYYLGYSSGRLAVPDVTQRSLVTRTWVGVAAFKLHVSIHPANKLGAFAELKKEKEATISFDICLPVRTEQLGYHWRAFHEIWYMNIFRKSVEKVQVSLKSHKNNVFVTWR